MSEPTEAQIVAAARVLNKRNAFVCNVDEEDSWKVYGEALCDMLRAYALAALASRPVGDGGADTLLRVIQRLNANPYSLTKAECISEVEDMLRAARTAGTDTAGGG